MGGDLVPAAARDAAARADEMVKQLALAANGQPQPEVTPPGEPVQPEVVAPQPAPAPQPTPSQEPTTVEQLLAVHPNNADERMYGLLQHAYKSLYGRAQAHRQRDQEQLQQASGRINELEVEINRLRAQPTPVTLPPGAPIEDLFTADERDNFGPELLDAVERAATKIAENRVAAFGQQVMPVISHIEGNTQQQREDRVVEFLDKQLELYNMIYFGPNGAGGLNEDPNFLRWLELTDPMTGAKRGQLLGSAWQAQDGNRMWAICSAYLNEVAPKPPATAIVTPPVPPAPRVPLASLAAPGIAARPTQAPTGPVEGSKEIYTRKDVADFYAKKRRGEFRGKEADVAETERLIALAGAEGRIV
jgi:hypothetical protein